MLSKYITKLVISILRNNEIARDDIMVVIKTIHDFELSVLKKKKEDYYDVFFSNTLSNVRTISRVWRKVQEHMPDLRGKEWELRQMKAGEISAEIIENQLKLF
jgi:hypothetical protein